MSRIKPIFLLPMLFIILLIGFFVSLTSGAVDIAVPDLLAWIVPGFLAEHELTQAEIAIIEHIRLPRALLVIVVGAALGISGAVIQGLFRNPLADPALIGVSGGAALGAVTAIVLFSAGGMSVGYIEWLKILMAFLGSVLATVLVFYIGYAANQKFESNRFSVAVVLLVGIAFNALAGALISMLAYLADDLSLRELTFWMMGSFSGAGWQEVCFATPGILLAITVFCALSKQLNILLLGDVEAEHLGVNVKQLQIKVMLFSALAVGAAVSVVGMVGFVGLIVPHILRLLMGPNMNYLLPGSAIGGAGLLVYADWVSRWLLSPAELPIGILTALLGAPFFLLLLLSRQYGVRP